MSRDYAADVKAMLRRAPNAKSVTFGATTVTRPVDIEERPEADAGGERLVTRTVVTVHPADFPSVARTSTLSIAGTAYVVRDIARVDDGELQELICAEDTP